MHRRKVEDITKEVLDARREHTIQRILHYKKTSATIDKLVNTLSMAVRDVVVRVIITSINPVVHGRTVRPNSAPRSISRGIRLACIHLIST